MAKKNKKEKPVVNYGEIKRNLIQRDTDFDSRYTTKVVKAKTHKKPKYKDWLKDY